MTQDEAAQVAQLITRSLERNLDSRLTAELATGILTTITHNMQPMIKEEAPDGEHV